MWSPVALSHFLKRHLARRQPCSLESVAAKTWTIAPGECSTTGPAYYLPGQLDRVTGWAFSNEHPRRQMEGGYRVDHSPTRGYLLQDAWLIDGTLYKQNASFCLLPRASLWPRFRADREIKRGALFCTPSGNKYFGMWLMDDCATYPLARAEGLPVTTGQRVSIHLTQYEHRLAMEPTRLESALFRELVIFDDVGQNRDKHRRFRALGNRLTAGVSVDSHPGVFILRGLAGTRRILRNEVELAEQLRVRRGFRILDPAKADVPTIIAACAGARTVVGVEGSGLMHGLMVLPQGGAILTLQPPNRFVGLYKHLADRDQQHFGFVVGQPQGDDFSIDLTEIERTLDLFPKLASAKGLLAGVCPEMSQPSLSSS